MMADEQTHTLPADADALEAFARFLGFAGRDAFAAVLLAHLRKVERHYVRLFERAPEFLAEQQNLSFARRRRRRTLDRLAQMGFRRPQAVRRAVRKWRAGHYRALRGEQARGNLIELVPVHHRSVLARGKSGRGIRCVRPFPRAGFAPAGDFFRCCGKIRS